MRRRDLLAAFGATALGQEAIRLPEFEPKSMLKLPETRVDRARFPVIDFHTHLTGGDALGGVEGTRDAAPPDEVLPVMDRKNIRTMVNLTGGYGKGLDETIARWDKKHPGRIVTFTEPWFAKTIEPGYSKFQADEIVRAKAAGARGIKVLKVLGLYLRENVKTGALVKVDDRRFDGMWEAAAAMKMPVAIHTSDPQAFFRTVDKYNERYEELQAHPNWSFHGKDFPSNEELQEARRRVMKRHPKTHFVCLHVADSEDLNYVGAMLDELPNMSVEIGARIGELGRQPKAARAFIEKYQDRVMFGTDAVPRGIHVPQQIFGDKLYEIYYRFLESTDEYFDYAPARVPPQGRWKIYGLGLTEGVLRKVYSGNAARALDLSA